MERKTLKFEVKELNEEEGTFTGYASTFTDKPDSYGDVVDKGAFKKTIKENKSRIKHLWNHSIMEPIGKPDELSEDDTGLFVKGRLVLGVQRARETLALMKAGVVNEMSIGYDTITDMVKDGVRHLKEVKLYDVSPVTFAANPTAMILDVKAVERALSNNDVEPIREAVKALQALLAKSEGKQEPAPATPEPEDTKEAADMESLLASIGAELDGFDAKQAEARIDQLISKYTEVK
ncbi:MAG: HK97 family phage prohead protease [Spirochaetota bacterium]